MTRTLAVEASHVVSKAVMSHKSAPKFRKVVNELAGTLGLGMRHKIGNQQIDAVVSN